jgi:hypothetical protein
MTESFERLLENHRGSGAAATGFQPRRTSLLYDNRKIECLSRINFIKLVRFIQIVEFIF